MFFFSSSFFPLSLHWLPFCASGDCCTHAVAATTANNTSSRSHCIIRVSMIESSSSTVSNDLFLVDLAGSEKVGAVV